MTEIRNLTRNGETFYPLTTSSAVINEATGEGLIIDDEPTPGSDNLVKSGGVQNELALGAVYDVSAKNPTAGPNNDGKFESFYALLHDANLNTLIPTNVRKGGMSIKFLQSLDSNSSQYVQYRYTYYNAVSINAFTNISNWEKTTSQGELDNVRGWTETIPSLSTTPVVITPIAAGKIIDSFSGATSLIFNTGLSDVLVNASDLPYKAVGRFVNVRAESGTLTNVSYHVRGVINDWFINVNDLNARHAAYSDKTTARNDVPANMRKVGIVITYLLSDGWHTERFVDTLDRWSINSAIWDSLDIRNIYDYIYGNTPITLRNGYRALNGSTIGDVVPSGSFRTALIEVSKGEVFRIAGNGTNVARLWGTVDSSMNIVRTIAGAVTTTEPIYVSIKEGEKYLCFNSEYNSIIAEYLTFEKVSIEDMINLSANQLPSLYKLGELNSDFNSQLPCTIVGTKGNPSCKYTFDLPLKKQFNIRFKFKVTQNIFSLTASVSKRIASLNGYNVMVAARRFTQYTSQYTVNGITKTSYWPVLLGGLGMKDTSSAQREDTNHNTGSFAFSVQYKGSSDNVTISNDGTQMVLIVDNVTVATLPYSTYDTMYKLFTALNAVTDFEAKCGTIEGHVPSELATFSDVKLVSYFYNNITGEQPTDNNKVEFKDAAPLYIPYAMDNAWHQVEISTYNGDMYIVMDGIYTKEESITIPEVSTFIMGSWVGCIFKDLEIDTQTVRDFEVVTPHTGGSLCISSVNPYFIIYEGHGLQDVPTEDVDIDEMVCTSDRLQLLIDKMKEKGYEAVSLERILQSFNGNDELPKRSYTMIFDDFRWENVLDLDLRSVFTRNGVYGALAIISDRDTAIIYNNNEISIDKAVDICKNANFISCSHTRNHRCVSSCKLSDLISEIQADIYSGDEKGINPNILVYPFGATNMYVIETLKWLGLDGAINVQYNSRNKKCSNKYNLCRRELGIRNEIDNIIGEIV